MNVLGPDITDSEKPKVLIEIINKYVIKFSDAIKGRNTIETATALRGGARIKYIFNNSYGTTLMQFEDSKELNDEEIRIAIRNAQCLEPVIFLSEASYSSIIRMMIHKIAQMPLDCVS